MPKNKLHGWMMLLTDDGCCSRMDVQHLYKANARKFIFVGLGPPVCAPHFLWKCKNNEK
jgi:hypothetical protein